eukprot:3719654-Prymnesium_polylepis.2
MLAWYMGLSCPHRVPRPSAPARTSLCVVVPIWTQCGAELELGLRSHWWHYENRIYTRDNTSVKKS